MVRNTDWKFDRGVKETVGIRRVLATQGRRKECEKKMGVVSVHQLLGT